MSEQPFLKVGDRVRQRQTGVLGSVVQLDRAGVGVQWDDGDRYVTHPYDLVLEPMAEPERVDRPGDQPPAELESEIRSVLRAVITGQMEERIGMATSLILKAMAASEVLPGDPSGWAPVRLCLSCGHPADSCGHSDGPGVPSGGESQ